MLPGQLLSCLLLTLTLGGFYYLRFTGTPFAHRLGQSRDLEQVWLIPEPMVSSSDPLVTTSNLEGGCGEALAASASRTLGRSQQGALLFLATIIAKI